MSWELRSEEDIARIAIGLLVGSRPELRPGILALAISLLGPKRLDELSSELMRLGITQRPILSKNASDGRLIKIE
jgi:hypothetical protein